MTWHEPYELYEPWSNYSDASSPAMSMVRNTDSTSMLAVVFKPQDPLYLAARANVPSLTVVFWLTAWVQDLGGRGVFCR